MELLQDLADFLKIDIKQENAVDNVFIVTLKYLDKIKSVDFEYEQLIPLRGILNKFANCASFNGIENFELSNATDDFIEIVNQTTYRPVVEESGLIYFFGKAPKKAPINQTNAPVYQKFQRLYNALIATYNLVKDGKPKSRELELEGFYNPDNSNKDKAKNLIVEARTQIERNTSLAAKPRKVIADFITKAIIEFDKPNSNWTVIFGRLKEVTSVLNALGSLATGIKGASSIDMALKKIEEGVQVIDQTSVNINYKTMNHIFDIEEGRLLIDSPSPKLHIEPATNLSEEEYEIEAKEIVIEQEEVQIENIEPIKTDAEPTEVIDIKAEEPENIERTPVPKKLKVRTVNPNSSPPKRKPSPAQKVGSAAAKTKKTATKTVIAKETKPKKTTKKKSTTN